VVFLPSSSAWLVPDAGNHLSPGTTHRCGSLIVLLMLRKESMPKRARVGLDYCGGAGSSTSRPRAGIGSPDCGQGPCAVLGQIRTCSIDLRLIAQEQLRAERPATKERTLEDARCGEGVGPFEKREPNFYEHEGSRQTGARASPPDGRAVIAKAIAARGGVDHRLLRFWGRMETPSSVQSKSRSGV